MGAQSSRSISGGFASGRACGRAKEEGGRGLKGWNRRRCPRGQGTASRREGPAIGPAVRVAARGSSLAQRKGGDELFYGSTAGLARESHDAHVCNHPHPSRQRANIVSRRQTIISPAYPQHGARLQCSGQATISVRLQRQRPTAMIRSFLGGADGIGSHLLPHFPSLRADKLFELAARKQCATLHCPASMQMLQPVAGSVNSDEN